jgi:hypothetical protein
LSEKYIKAVSSLLSFLFSDSLHELPIHFFRLMLKLAAQPEVASSPSPTPALLSAICYLLFRRDAVAP